MEDKSLYTIEVMKSICTECMDWEIFREISLLDVQEDALYRPFNTLSNGEQTKVLLAALFLTESCFLLIDEPTNHLDIDARNVVQNYLKRKKGLFWYLMIETYLINALTIYCLSIKRISKSKRKFYFLVGEQNVTR